MKLALLAPLVLLATACGPRVTVGPEPAPSASGPSAEVSASAPPPSASAPPAAASKPPPAVVALRPVPLAPGAVAAIWTRSRKGGADVTHFVRDGREIAKKAGVYLIARDRLYRWDARSRTSASERCEPPQSNTFARRVLHDGALVPVAGGARVVVEDFAAPSAEVQVEQEKHLPFAILGDALFVRSESAFYGCGVHPGYGVALKVVRVGEGGRLAEVTLDELRSGAEARLDDAVAALNKDARPDDTSLDGVLDARGVEVSMAFPAFEAGGGRWTAQYTGSATWAGSDGLWGGYTRSVRLELPGLPPALAGLAEFPQDALDRARAHAAEEVRGVSSGVVEVPR